MARLLTETAPLHLSQSTSTHDLDIRSSWYERLPAFLQGFLTWLSAKPYPGQPPTNHAPPWHLFTSLTAVGTGLALFVIGWRFARWPLQLTSLLFTTAGLRKLQVVVFHHCSHGTVLHKEANALLGELISGLVLVKSFAVYEEDHLRHHSRKYLLSEYDETVQFLVSFVGLGPGIPKHRLWRNLLLNFLNPAFHARWLVDRMISCFGRGPLAWRIAKLVYWTTLLVAIAYTHAWRPFLLGWILPLTALYHISATLRLAAEHRWPDNALLKSRSPAFVCDTTVAVFLGAPLPRGPLWRQPLAMARWMIEMLGHFLARSLVLVGDTPCHDFHHRRPASRNWANYIFARQADYENGCPGYASNYTEVWGLFRAIDENLRSLSAIDKETSQVEQRGLPIHWARARR